MKKIQHIYKPSLVYIKDRKILMARSKGKDLFYIPGGKVEMGETNNQALSREVFEELNVRLIEDSIKEVFTLKAQAHGKPVGTMCIFTCLSAELAGEPTPSSEIAEIKYFSTKDIHLTPEAGVLILNKLKMLDLID